MPVLDRDECLRAARYRSEEPRASFVVARGILRHLLGAYLDVEPGGLCFHVGRHGKPELAPHPRRDALYFNLSRRGMAVAYALSRHRCVGIDIERICGDLDTRRLARYAFSPRANHALDQLGKEQRQAAFFRGWSRKEALAKATGEGLTGSIQSTDIGVMPGNSASAVQSEDGQSPGRWHLFDIVAMPGYVCTVAVQSEERPTLQLRYVEAVCCGNYHGAPG